MLISPTCSKEIGDHMRKSVAFHFLLCTCTVHVAQLVELQHNYIHKRIDSLIRKNIHMWSLTSLLGLNAQQEFHGFTLALQHSLQSLFSDLEKHSL